MGLEERLIREMVANYPRTTAPALSAFEADAELVALSDSVWLAVTTDHVDPVNDFLPAADAWEVGHHAASAGLSDLAAVGADPLGLLLSVVAPGSFSPADAAALSRGVAEAARASGAAVLGGDTTIGGTLSATVTAVGTVPAGRAMLRSGGAAGDLLCVTGPVGRANGRAYAHATGRALAPSFRARARSSAGVRLREAATSCTDTSDGLLAAVANLARVTDVRYQIDDRPELYDREATDLLREDGLPAFPLLAGAAGEFELLFTVPPEREERLRRAGLDYLPVGRVCEGSGCVLVTDREEVAIDLEALQVALDVSASPAEYLVRVLMTLGLDGARGRAN